ncbi:MAG: type VI secretion protein IcmF/TssM N-terminal domain-containing protein [Geminicoccaceae bacterium]
MSDENIGRRFAAILAADVVGFSKHMARDEERTLARLRGCRQILGEEAAGRGGRVFSESGDAMLAEFGSPVEALRAAVAVQKMLAEKNQKEADGAPFLLRIGLNIGDVISDGDNLYGDEVNIASRIEGLAEPGGIALSRSVFTYVNRKIDYTFEKLDPQPLKNMDHPIDVYALKYERSAPRATVQQASQAGSYLRRLSKRPVRAESESLDITIDAASAFMRRSSKIAHNGDRVPRFLFLGGADSGIADLLEAAAAESPFKPPAQPNPSETFHWTWWLFRKLIAIETSQTFVEGIPEEHRLDAWSTALNALQAHRPAMPVNGYVICIPQHVLHDPSICRERGYAIRRLLDLATTTLNITAPVYLLITRLDDLPGFADFRAALPSGTDRQVMGHLIEDPSRFSDNRVLLATALQSMHQRFHKLRLGMLRHEGEAAGKRGVFDFVHGLTKVIGGVSAMVDCLTTKNELQNDVRLRGVFMTADGQEPAFYRDLFERFLPQDQPLSHVWTENDHRLLQAAA